MPDGCDLARCFGADHDRQLPPGERHAPEAPYVDMVQADGLDADLNLAGPRRGRRIDLREAQVAIAKELESFHSDRAFSAMHAQHRGEAAIDGEDRAGDVGCRRR